MKLHHGLSDEKPKKYNNEWVHAELGSEDILEKFVKILKISCHAHIHKLWMKYKTTKLELC